MSILKMGLAFFFLLGGMAVAQSPITEPYLLGPGDVLEISVWDDPNLSRKTIIRPDGGISFPLLGDIQASGLTVAELQKRVQAKLKEYIPNSPVTIILDELGHSRVYVVGKVNKPGVFLITGEMRVLQALAMAGGLTTFADSGDIIILRNTPKGQKVMHFDYADVVGGENLEQNIRLEPGDTIAVP